MSKHERVDGKLLQLDKKYSQLKNAQKEKINRWMLGSYTRFYHKHGRFPMQKDTDDVLTPVMEKIEAAEIWIPYGEVAKHYRGKMGAYHSQVVREEIRQGRMNQTHKQHTMKLQPSPFEMIKSGAKTIELRLYDEKRRKIQIGDTIVFAHTENPAETLAAKVTALFIFDSFASLYETLPLLECGYTEANIDTASPKDMEAYYPEELQKKYNVVGIRIALQ